MKKYSSIQICKLFPVAGKKNGFIRFPIGIVKMMAIIYISFADVVDLYFKKYGNNFEKKKLYWCVCFCGVVLSKYCVLHTFACR